MDTNDFKNEFLNIIHKKIALSTFNTWFKDIEFKIDNNDIYLVAPHESCKKHLKINYEDIIEDSILEVNSEVNYVDIITKNEKVEEPTNNKQEEILEILDNDIDEEYKNYSNFNPKYTFDNYIVGNSNRFAYTAAMTVAEKPGVMYNPLFLYGNSGLGKTHLMHAIGNYIKQHSNKKVLYITTEQFVNDLILMYKKDGDDNLGYIELFRKKYRDVDVLMIDDIQFLGGAIKSQQEFTNTFNSLYDNEKQIIIASDTSIDDYKYLEDRLKTRFRWGLTESINPPEIELKKNIIKNKIRINKYDLDISDEVIDYIANNCGNNIRTLEGAVLRIVAYKATFNIPVVTLDIAMEALQEFVDYKQYKDVSVSKIIDIVAKYYNLDSSMLKGKMKKKNVTDARAIAMYLSRILTEESLQRIGLEFGGRDHSTVIYSHEKRSN